MIKNYNRCKTFRKSLYIVLKIDGCLLTFRQTYTACHGNCNTTKERKYKEDIYSTYTVWHEAKIKFVSSLVVYRGAKFLETVVLFEAKTALTRLCMESKCAWMIETGKAFYAAINDQMFSMSDRSENRINQDSNRIYCVSRKVMFWQATCDLGLFSWKMGFGS